MNEGKLTLVLVIVSIMLMIESLHAINLSKENKLLRQQVQALQAGK